jgi:protocatechuate 3,4-dioxygenase beta subunit
MATVGLILFPTIASASDFGLKTENKPAHQTDIRRGLFGKQIEITGQIFDASGKNPLNEVQLEFWHLSPNTDIVGHRGSLLTDENGRYQIFTDYPNREFGKHTTIHFKISKEEQASSTELKFSDFGAHITDKHWEANSILDQDLLFSSMEKSLYRTKFNFNFTINQ